MNPLTISDWKRLTAEDPIKAADHLIDSLDRVPAQTRRSVFSCTLDADALRLAFAHSARKPDLPLAGVPFALKDLFDAPGLPTTASSTFLADLRDKPTSACALLSDTAATGAVLGAKTHLNEFAYGLSGENPHFGNCPHPIDGSRLSGGSSSGSAWAVASGLFPIAFGTDTGGSIRVPAAWCNLFGLRLAPDRWSRDGCFPLAPSFDTAGWFCRNADDMALAWRALVGQGEPVQTESKLRGLNLISLSEAAASPFGPKVLQLAEAIQCESNKTLADRYENVSKDAARHFSVLQSIEALEVHRSWLDDRKDQYDPAVWQRIARARSWTVADIEAAKEAEQAITAFFEEVLSAFDFALLPVTWTPAQSADQQTDALRNELLGFTAPGSLAKLPILTLPIADEQTGLSIGLQAIYRDPKSDLPLRLLKALQST